MKKLSLILALVLVFACTVLAACNEESATSSEAAASSEAASTPVSEAESEAVSEVESEAASEEASEEASGDTSGDEEQPSDLEGVVISAGAAYTMQDLFRQNSSWQWDATCDPAYPDTDGVEMTDGILAPAEAHQLYDGTGAAWAGFHSMHPDYESLGYAWITVDLGESKEITGAKLYSASSIVSEAAAANLTVLVSDDGETWTTLGTAAVVDDASLAVIDTTVVGSANAQYVQFQFTAAGYWIGVCEVEVYGAAE